jgi:phenazine biosynthesis protein phzE
VRNFVIRRDFTAGVDADAATAALTLVPRSARARAGRVLDVRGRDARPCGGGASPEAHVSARDGIVTMNPISGTFRHPDGGVTVETLTEFLESTKETEELFMVVDEELKMMSAVCSDGGRITGPHLKEMSRLTHTEYVLRGRSRLDPRDILRETMFAPTVTGSPMQNACTVITRHERTPRGYYSGVAALFTPRTDAVRAGRVHARPRRPHPDPHRLPCRRASARAGRRDPGASLRPVRRGQRDARQGRGRPRRDRCRPAQPPSRTAAAGGCDRPRCPHRRARTLADDPDVAALLASRNARLASFWLNPQDSVASGPFVGLSAIVVDAEDRFTTMLAHQLRHLGLEVEILPWSAVTDEQVDGAELVVSDQAPATLAIRARPACADARRSSPDVRARAAPCSRSASAIRSSPTPFGIELAPLSRPHQGLQKTVDLFGMPASIGFYNTFTARVPGGTTAVGEAEVARGPVTGDVYALRGPGFASVQGHLESILSRDGYDHAGAARLTRALPPSVA